MGFFLTILFLKLDLSSIDFEFSSRLFQKTVEVGRKDLKDSVRLHEMLFIQSAFLRLYLFQLLVMYNVWKHK